MGGEMNQALYAHMNNKRKMKKKILKAMGSEIPSGTLSALRVETFRKLATLPARSHPGTENF
jgi:hypothetical protein